MPAEAKRAVLHGALQDQADGAELPAVQEVWPADHRRAASEAAAAAVSWEEKADWLWDQDSAEELKVLFPKECSS